MTDPNLTTIDCLFDDVLNVEDVGDGTITFEIIESIKTDRDVCVVLGRAQVKQVIAILSNSSGVTATPKRRSAHGPQEYKGNGKHAWQQVTVSSGEQPMMARLRVPGGWLYAQRDNATHAISTAQTFVPLPDVVDYDI